MTVELHGLAALEDCRDNVGREVANAEQHAKILTRIPLGISKFGNGSIASVAQGLPRDMRFDDQLDQRRITHAIAAPKHADFRQAWINSLRDEMSTFQSLAVGSALDDKDNEQKLAASGTKILLLMNPKDPEYKALLNGLHAVMAGWRVSRSNFLIKHAEMNALCQRILKREWNVTNREMHAIAHYFWMRWLIGLWRGFAWVMKKLYRFVILPVALWLEPRVWNWTKWGFMKGVAVRRAYLARKLEFVIPDAIDLDAMDDRKEGLASLVVVADDPVPAPQAGFKWLGLGRRVRAAAAHVYRGRAVP